VMGLDSSFDITHRASGFLAWRLQDNPLIDMVPTGSSATLPQCELAHCTYHYPKGRAPAPTACYKRYRLNRAGPAPETSEPMMRSFERRKAAYLAFVEKQRTAGEIPCR
jgi:hypothetical protein